MGPGRWLKRSFPPRGFGSVDICKSAQDPCQATALMIKPFNIDNWVPHPCAFFAQGWETTKLNQLIHQERQPQRKQL
jgi:hypothetical protein